MNSFLKFFARVKKNKRLKAPRARTIEKNDIATGKSGDINFLILLHLVYNCISYKIIINLHIMTPYPQQKSPQR